MTIEEYRNNLDIIDKKYNILIPPIVSIIPQVEILKNNCVINDLNNINNYQGNNNSSKINTLANYMNIKTLKSHI